MCGMHRLILYESLKKSQLGCLSENGIIDVSHIRYDAVLIMTDGQELRGYSIQVPLTCSILVFGNWSHRYPLKRILESRRSKIHNEESIPN